MVRWFFFTAFGYRAIVDSIENTIQHSHVRLMPLHLRPFHYYPTASTSLTARTLLIFAIIIRRRLHGCFGLHICPAIHPILIDLRIEFQQMKIHRVPLNILNSTVHVGSSIVSEKIQSVFFSQPMIHWARNVFYVVCSQTTYGKYYFSEHYSVDTRKTSKCTHWVDNTASVVYSEFRTLTLARHIQNQLMALADKHSAVCTDIRFGRTNTIASLRMVLIYWHGCRWFSCTVD